MDIINPATNETIATLRLPDKAEITVIAAKARESITHWRHLPLQKRIEAIRMLLDLLLERQDLFAQLIAMETGKTIQEALAYELFPVLELMSFYTRKAKKVLPPRAFRVQKLRSSQGAYICHPYGVILLLSPYPLSFYVAMSQAVMALLAGNVVLQKPSLHTPMSMLKVKELWEQVPAPMDAFQIIPGDNETGRSLIECDVDLVSFTGDSENAKLVAQQCITRQTPFILHPGGKCAGLFTSKTIRQQRFVSQVTRLAFANAGQCCTALDHLYIHEKVYEEVVEEFVKQTEAIRSGDNLLPDTDIGFLTIPERQTTLKSSVEDAIEQGACILTGYRPGDELQNAFFPPTIITDVIPEMKILQSENLAPILTVSKYEKESDAITEMKALGMCFVNYFFTSDPGRIWRTLIAEEMRCRVMVTNSKRPLFADVQSHFVGGISEKDTFRSGQFGLHKFCRESVMETSRKIDIRKKFYQYPYGEKFIRKIKKWAETFFQW